ncbi:hypothetical protein QM012_003657 [Aureobasidium pullulans]|uniref:Uncharacterized protein n=1 Tax=Aureobasidium pullulans TaxID=5580 RepID=A0ABR0T8Z4_AURPU
MDSESSISTSSSEPRTPTSTSDTNPSASPAVPLSSERPTPGSFRYMPYGTRLNWCSKQNPGNPGGHPVLILSWEAPDSTLVRVLFTTTKDVVGCTSAKSWACNYVPLEGQLHPWRDAIPLVQGCVAFPKPTSINVSTEYVVDWRDLEDVKFTSPDMFAPCLSAEVLDKLEGYVDQPCADSRAPWKIVPPRVQAREMVRLNYSTPAAPAPGLAPTPVSVAAPVAVPVAILAPVPTQETTQAYVPPFCRSDYLSPMVAVVNPIAPWQYVHPAYRYTSWWS